MNAENETVVQSTDEEIAEYVSYMAIMQRGPEAPMTFSEWQKKKIQSEFRKLQEQKWEELTSKMHYIMTEAKKWNITLETVGESGHFAHCVAKYGFIIK